MSQPIGNRIHILKKVFVVLLVLDFVDLVQTVITMFPTFRELAEYGALMLWVTIAITAVAAAVLLFEVLAKIFLVRSMSPAFPKGSGRKGYAAAAKLLLPFNLCAVVIQLLSAGGEGATLLNQGYLYLQVLASAAEMAAVLFYLRAAKR